MPINRIAFYHLETLFWISRLGTFGAAAGRLNTTQPAISARIRELESHLGIPLFRKEGRSMTLTPAGRKLIRESEPLWAQFQRVLTDCSDRTEASGIVRIGAGEIAAASCLPSFVAQLHNEMPRVSLEIEIALTADLIQQLLIGRSDIVFVAGNVDLPALRSRPIGSVELLWLASPSSVAAMQRGEPPDHFPIWSLASPSPLFRIMRDAIARSRLGTRSVNLCNNVRSLIDIVTAGRGIAIFPRSMVQGQIAEQALMPVPDTGAIDPVHFQAAVRATETDPLILDIFERASQLDIATGL
jgi:DNA-binding transcriptional LysR family regulator